MKYSPLFLAALALPALALANQSYPDHMGRFELARTQLRADVTGRLNRYWNSERGRRQSMGQAFMHYLGVSNGTELDALKADAARRGQLHVAEVERREIIARESAQLAADGVHERGMLLFARSWDRFRTNHVATEYPGVPQVASAFYGESPELVAFLRGRTPLQFSGEAVSPGWLQGLTPEAAVAPVLEEDAPRVEIPLTPVAQVDVSNANPIDAVTVSPLSGGGGLFGTDPAPVGFTGADDPSQVVSLPTALPTPVMTPVATPVATPAPTQTAAITPPAVDGDNDAQSADTGWGTITISRNQTLGDLGVQIRRTIPRNLRPALWGPDGIVDLLYQANMGHIDDPNVLSVGDIVRVPTQAWFEKM